MTETPKFNKPPVVETVIGVQFPEIDGFSAVHFGLYWRAIRDRFKNFEDKPRLPPVVEQFPRNIVLPYPRVELSEGAGPDRMWYTAQTESELIQLQPDRFLFNWRQQGAATRYPSYDANKKKFLDEFKNFQKFCEENQLKEPSPNLCEVTYINHLVPQQGESSVQLFGKVFSGLRWEACDDWLPEPESATFNRVFRIERNRQAVGRLYAEAAIALKRREKKEQEFVLFRVTGRVMHPFSPNGNLVDSLQLAHDWVVKGFASMTDRRIQEDRWERSI